MGTPGIPLVIPKDAFVTALKQNKGVVSRVCKSLDICHNSVHKLIAEYELKELLDNLRNNYKTTLLDDAEDNLAYAMQQRDKDLNNTLKASFFVLNNLGKERGYAHPSSSSLDDAEKTIAQKALFHGLKDLLDNRRSPSSSNAEMAAE